MCDHGEDLSDWASCGVTRGTCFVNLSYVIISFILPRKPSNGSVTRGIMTLERAFLLMSASMMTIQFGFAAKFLAAVFERADKDCFGLNTKADVVCGFRLMGGRHWSRSVIVLGCR
jgi:hypothetical protein